MTLEQDKSKKVELFTIEKCIGCKCVVKPQELCHCGFDTVIVEKGNYNYSRMYVASLDNNTFTVCDLHWPKRS